MGTALTIAEAQDRVVAPLPKKIVSEANRIVTTVLRAPDLYEHMDENGRLPVDEDGRMVVPPNWTKRDVKVAIDSLLPKSKAPVYVDVAIRTVENNARLVSAQKQGQQITLNVQKLIVPVTQQRSYEVIDVTCEEKDR